MINVPGSSIVLLSLPQDAVPNLQREVQAMIGNVSRFDLLDLVCASTTTCRSAD
jgi:hypothetical protein